MPLNVVGVSGSPTTPSRTSVLVDETASAIASRLGGDVTLIELAPLLGELGAGPYRANVGPNVERALQQVENADLLVVGSPAYRATYTGLFKLFFDHIGQYALQDTPVVLTATGGSDRHALLVEHQMRPLFGFFQALTLPLGIYGNQDDFVDYKVAAEDLRTRIDTSVDRIVRLVASRTELASSEREAEFAQPPSF